MLLVSIEGLPCACRDAVTKIVQARAGGGAATVPECPARRSQDPLVDSLGFLLHQARALRHTSAPVVVSQASWLDKAPDPRARGLYADLAGALRRRLGLEGQHHMVYLRADAHEAFESVIDSGADGRDVGLRTLLDLQSRLDACASGTLPPDALFPATVQAVACPPFAADAPGAVARAADAALAALPQLRSRGGSAALNSATNGFPNRADAGAGVDQDAPWRLLPAAAAPREGHGADPGGGVHGDPHAEQVCAGVDAGAADAGDR
jgi:hypothetical protein